MPHYTVGQRWWFDELGRKADAGETVELPEDAAERYMHNEPGLLKPARQTTQAHPQVAREPSRPARPTRKPRKTA